MKLFSGSSKKKSDGASPSPVAAVASVTSLGIANTDGMTLEDYVQSTLAEVDAVLRTSPANNQGLTSGPAVSPSSGESLSGASGEATGLVSPTTPLTVQSLADSDVGLGSSGSHQSSSSSSDSPSRLPKVDSVADMAAVKDSITEFLEKNRRQLSPSVIALIQAIQARQNYAGADQMDTIPENDSGLSKALTFAIESALGDISQRIIPCRGAESNLPRALDIMQDQKVKKRDWDGGYESTYQCVIDTLASKENLKFDEKNLTHLMKALKFLIVACKDKENESFKKLINPNIAPQVNLNELFLCAIEKGNSKLAVFLVGKGLNQLPSNFLKVQEMTGTARYNWDVSTGYADTRQAVVDALSQLSRETQFPPEQQQALMECFKGLFESNNTKFRKMECDLLLNNSAIIQQVQLEVLLIQSIEALNGDCVSIVLDKNPKNVVSALLKILEMKDGVLWSGWRTGGLLSTRNLLIRKLSSADCELLESERNNLLKLLEHLVSLTDVDCKQLLTPALLNRLNNDEKSSLLIYAVTMGHFEASRLICEVCHTKLALALEKMQSKLGANEQAMPAYQAIVARIKTADIHLDQEGEKSAILNVFRFMIREQEEEVPTLLSKQNLVQSFTEEDCKELMEVAIVSGNLRAVRSLTDLMNYGHLYTHFPLLLSQFLEQQQWVYESQSPQSQSNGSELETESVFMSGIINLFMKGMETSKPQMDTKENEPVLQHLAVLFEKGYDVVWLHRLRQLADCFQNINLVSLAKGAIESDHTKSLQMLADMIFERGDLRSLAVILLMICQQSEKESRAQINAEFRQQMLKQYMAKLVDGHALFEKPSNEVLRDALSKTLEEDTEKTEGEQLPQAPLIALIRDATLLVKLPRSLGKSNAGRIEDRLRSIQKSLKKLEDGLCLRPYYLIKDSVVDNEVIVTVEVLHKNPIQELALFFIDHNDNNGLSLLFDVQRDLLYYGKLLIKAVRQGDVTLVQMLINQAEDEVGFALAEALERDTNSWVNGTAEGIIGKMLMQLLNLTRRGKFSVTTCREEAERLAVAVCAGYSDVDNAGKVKSTPSTKFIIEQEHCKPLYRQIEVPLFIAALGSGFDPLLVRIMDLVVQKERRVGTLLLALHRSQVDDSCLHLKTDFSRDFLSGLMRRLREPDLFASFEPDRDRTNLEKVIEAHMGKDEEEAVQLIKLPHIAKHLNFQNILIYAISASKFNVANFVSEKLNTEQSHLRIPIFLSAIVRSLEHLEGTVRYSESQDFESEKQSMSLLCYKMLNYLISTGFFDLLKRNSLPDILVENNFFKRHKEASEIDLQENVNRAVRLIYGWIDKMYLVGEMRCLDALFQVYEPTDENVYLDLITSALIKIDFTSAHRFLMKVSTIPPTPSTLLSKGLVTTIEHDKSDLAGLFISKSQHAPANSLCPGFMKALRKNNLPVLMILLGEFEKRNTPLSLQLFEASEASDAVDPPLTAALKSRSKECAEHLIIKAEQCHWVLDFSQALEVEKSYRKTTWSIGQRTTNPVLSDGVYPVLIRLAEPQVREEIGREAESFADFLDSAEGSSAVSINRTINSSI